MSLSPVKTKLALDTFTKVETSLGFSDSVAAFDIGLSDVTKVPDMIDDCARVDDLSIACRLDHCITGFPRVTLAGYWLELRLAPETVFVRAEVTH